MTSVSSISYQEWFAADRESTDVAGVVIEDLWVNFESVLNDKEADLLALDYAIDDTMNRLSAILFLSTFDYDGVVPPIPPEGDNATVENILPFELLVADEEPAVCAIDTWARGSVPTRRITDDTANYRLPPSTTRTPSINSFRSSATGRSRFTASSAGRSRTSRSSRGSVAAPHDNRTGRIIPLDDDLDGSFDILNTTGPLFNQLQKAKRRKERGYIPEGEGVKSEFEIMEEQLAKAAKEVGGKRFVLDRYGQPVVIGKVNPHTLPNFTAPVSLAVRVPGATTKKNRAEREQNIFASVTGPLRALEQSERGQLASAGGKRKLVRVAGSRGVEEAQFEATRSLATVLSTLDSIPKVSAGVTIRSRAGQKSGEELSDNPRYISKKKLLARTQAASNGFEARRSQLECDSLAESSTSMLLSVPPHRGGRMLDSSLYDDSSVSRGGRSGAIKTHMDGGELSRTLAQTSDFDPFEGSKVIPPPERANDPDDASLGLGPMHSNGNITRAKLPVKPSASQRAVIDLLRGSGQHGKPRDRDFPHNAIPVASRKHLPAPPPGYVTGHGNLIPNQVSDSLSLFSSSFEQ